ncbi:hypothetical protein PTKIN_Ptkin03bG0162000 [Pterospermum kingtungense]
MVCRYSRKLQSPIDLLSEDVQLLPSLAKLKRDYKPAPAVVKNRGHGITGLEKCQLKTTISDLPNKLDSSVSDEGENWSVGQRQLFCLGRVHLKRNRILVLHEATASIDSATDAILQRIIIEELSNCTVITVAHRVPTVLTVTSIGHNMCSFIRVCG